MKKKEKLESKEFYKEKIVELENDVYKIFEKLTSEKDMSSYQLEILYNKLENLNIAIANNLTKFVEAENLIVKKMKRYLTFFIIASLLFFPALFINTFLALGFGSLWIFTAFKTAKYYTSKQTNSYDEDLSFLKDMEHLDIEFDKCYNLIDFINNTRSEKACDESINLDTKKFDIANDIIYAYLNNEIVNWNNFPKEIQNLVINILQNDLNSNENDITKLITLAKISIEKVKKSEEFSESVLKLINKKDMSN